MKNNKTITQNLLKKYQTYYQTHFKFIYNEEVLFDELYENQDIYHYSINFLNKQGELLSNKEIQIDLLQITLQELLNIDINSILEKSLEEELTSLEIEYLQNEYKSNDYTLLLIQSNKKTQHLYSMISNIVTSTAYEVERNQKVVVLYPNKIDKSLMMQIKDTLETELYCKIYMACSSLFHDLKEISTQYQEACDLLKIYIKYDFMYFDDQNVFLAYVIENMKEDKIDALYHRLNIESFYLLDDEMVNTIQMFYHNNLNIAETARKMYIHRNTFIYRIEKIKAITGFDIRNFDEALKVQFALLLMKK